LPTLCGASVYCFEIWFQCWRLFEIKRLERSGWLACVAGFRRAIALNPNYADGSNVRRLTNHPAFDNFPVFAPDGTAIVFQSNRENERTEIYLQNLNDSSPQKISNFNGTTGIGPKCWSADGTQMLLWTDQNGKAKIVRANIEPYPSKLILSDETAGLSFPRLAPDGRQILYQAHLEDRNVELRLTDLETRATKTIFKTAPNYPLNSQLAPAWSPDGHRIVFNDRANGNSEIFIINADGSGLQNLTNDPLLDANPVFSPDGNEIIFVRVFYGNARLYRMNLGGGGQRRLTEKNGYEMAPAFSPDGKRIAFASIADGNAEIYLMNADGTDLFRLTRTKAEESAPQFSADGKKLFFAANRNGKFAIYEIELP